MYSWSKFDTSKMSLVNSGLKGGVAVLLIIYSMFKSLNHGWLRSSSKSFFEPILVRGFLSKHLATKSWQCWVTGLCYVSNFRGGNLTYFFLIILISFSSLKSLGRNGTFPKSISNKKIPRVHQSRLKEWPFYSIISGAIYCLVPQIEEDSSPFSRYLAIPKSMRLT